MNRGLVIGGSALSIILFVVALYWVVKRARKKGSLVGPLSLVAVAAATAGVTAWGANKANAQAQADAADAQAQVDKQGLPASVESLAAAGGAALNTLENLGGAAVDLARDAWGGVRRIADMVTPGSGQPAVAAPPAPSTVGNETNIVPPKSGGGPAAQLAQAEAAMSPSVQGKIDLYAQGSGLMSWTDPNAPLVGTLGVPQRTQKPFSDLEGLESLLVQAWTPKSYVVEYQPNVTQDILGTVKAIMARTKAGLVSLQPVAGPTILASPPGPIMVPAPNPTNAQDPAASSGYRVLERATINLAANGSAQIMISGSVDPSGPPAPQGFRYTPQTFSAASPQEVVDMILRVVDANFDVVIRYAAGTPKPLVDRLLLAGQQAGARSVRAEAV